MTPKEKYSTHAMTCFDCFLVDCEWPDSSRCPEGAVLVRRAVQADIEAGRCMPSGESKKHFEKRTKRSP